MLAGPEDPSPLTALLLRLSDDPARLAVLHRFFCRYTHHVRNRLNGIKLSLYLARRTTRNPADLAALDGIASQYDQLELLFDQFQGFYREPELQPVEAPFVAFLRERARQWAELLALSGQNFVFTETAGESLVRFDPSRLGGALDQFRAWRSREAGEGTTFSLAVSRFGPWLVAEWTEAESRHHRGGAGAGRVPRLPNLALPLLSRLVAAHGGSFITSSPRTYRFELALAGRPSTAGPAEAELARKAPGTFSTLTPRPASA